MKKINFILFITAFLLAACSAVPPQATVPPPPQTSEAFDTVPAGGTSEVSPTPTLHPQFISLQEIIAASGERFTLTPQGFIEDNGAPIPGLTVAPDGTMTLTVNGETVTLDPADVTFDDENGISIEGYERDKNGEWVEVADTEPNTDLTPEQSAQITELNEKWNGVLEIDPETFEITSKAGGGASVEGMEYNPETGKIKLTFYSDGLGRDFSQIIDPDFIVFGNYEGKPVNVKNIVKALTIGENGQIERVFAKDDGGVTSVPLRTPQEFNEMMVEDHSKTASHAETQARMDELYDVFIKKGVWEKGNGGWWYIRLKDLYAKLAIGAWGSNSAIVWNPETNEFDDIEVPTYQVMALDNYTDHSVGIVLWIGEDEEPNFELVAGPANIHKSGSIELGHFGQGK